MTVSTKSKKAPKSSKTAQSSNKSGRLPLTQVRVLKLLKASKSPMTIADFAKKGCGYGPSISNFVGRVHQERENLAQSRVPTLIDLGLVTVLLPEEGRAYRFAINGAGSKALEASLKALNGKIPPLRERNLTTKKAPKTAPKKAPKSKN